MSNGSRRTPMYRAGDRVVITERYRGALGPKVHGRAGKVHKVSYPRKGAKFVWVHLDGEDVLSVVLTFADELSPEPDHSDDVYHDSLKEPTQEQRVEAWAQDPEGKQLVQNILQRKADGTPVRPTYLPDYPLTETGFQRDPEDLHVFLTPKEPKVGDTIHYLGKVKRDG